MTQPGDATTSPAPPWLPEAARVAAWGLMKGGHLDARDGNSVDTLILRAQLLELARLFGVSIDLDGQGIGAIYTLDELVAIQARTQ